MEDFYDKKAEFEKDTEIATALNNLKILLNRQHIPFFFTAAISNLEDGTTEYYKDMLSPFVCGINLNDNRIGELLNVMNGFNTYYPFDSKESDYGNTEGDIKEEAEFDDYDEENSEPNNEENDGETDFSMEDDLTEGNDNEDE